MSGFRIRFELNKGRHGIPLRRLANISSEVEKFLEMFGRDMKFDNDGWVADNFENGSLKYDVNYIGETSDQNILVAKKAFEAILDSNTTANDLKFGIRKETFWQFAQIANQIDPDDYIGIGLYQDNSEFNLKELSKERSLLIESQIEEKTFEFGGIQGEISALLKGINHLWINELESGTRVICTFCDDIYREIWQLLKNHDTVVNIEGWITRENGKIIRFDIESIVPAVIYREGDLEKFFGSDPDFTGNLDTEDYISNLRDEIT